MKHHLFYFVKLYYLVNNNPVNVITHYYKVLTYSTGFFISPILAIEIPHFAAGVQKNIVNGPFSLWIKDLKNVGQKLHEATND